MTTEPTIRGTPPLAHGGLLLLRIGLACLLIVQGLAKLLPGSAGWVVSGATLTDLGFPFPPALLGLVGAGLFTWCGFCLLLGWFYRPASLLLGLMLLLLALLKYDAANGIASIIYQLQLAVVFFALALLGPGTLSIDTFRAIRKQKRRAAPEEVSR